MMLIITQGTYILIIHQPTHTHTKRKIGELGNEANFLRGVLDRFVKSRTKVQREAQEREELLARRYEVGDEDEDDGR